ncbi:Wzz/FepE/Etk N-terminal domain-containing protein [Thermus scotoductus]|uniref:Lipopolysaccharide biosynthesis protein n=1 Tax=Thermus scotoductus TaxID=37636 RepID=A0A430S091_THESC|nr:Wzz/FepE/Etk N-terminal domain-containing protein [Thermus scotoductus]RTH26920.1 lipopolysaccharide biosynthesis protein [Thermus scotoductus]RTI41142.1 lipopolysaccharide biosynthesis protein [Thermus scotoductus]
MVEAPGEELSLRDILETLKRQRVWLLAPPVLFGVLALIYGFFIAEPRYASTATVNVAPVQVQAQLEGRIQVQGQSLLSFQALRAIAYSEEVTREVWETLRREGKLPTAWQDQGGTPGLERMVKDFKIKDETPRQQVVPQGQVPPVVASLTVQAPTPEVAARAANLWAEAVVKRVNAIPTARLRASLGALEEQIAPAEKVYREAQARWEAFQRTTTLPQDKAELDAKTGERVSLDQELSGLERDLAAVQGRIRALEAEARRQAALVPIGTSPEQLAIIGRRLKEAQENLKRETERARQSYALAAQALERFKGRERIPVWQAELNAYTEGYASAQSRLLAIEKELAVNDTRLKEARDRLSEYKAQLPSLSIENLVAGLTVKEAEALVAERLREADARLKAAEAAWQAYQRESQLNVLKQQLGGFADRVAGIRQRLEKIPTERAVLQRRLAEAEAELAKEPKLLALEREVVADPVVAAAIARGGDLQALVGLKLKNQELNPTHQKLLFTALDLRADLAALDREEQALRDEEARLQPQVESLQERIAVEEARRARLLLDLDTARDIYGAVYRYAENLKRLAAKPEMRLREVSPDVLRFRDQVVDLEAQKASLEAERVALERNLKEYDRRIQALKGQLASQEREKEALLLEYSTKKAAYETFRARYDQIANLTSADLAFDNPNPEYQRLRSVLIDAQAEEARLLARRAALEARMAQVEARINLLKERVAKAQVEQDRINQALELAKNAYLALSQKRTDLQIELASSESSLAQVIAPAYPIYEKVAPKRALILALAVFLGLVLGVMAAFVAEALRPPRAEAAG